jgi:hypothetical protein
VFHIGNCEIGKFMECRRDKNFVPVYRRKKQVACTVEMYQAQRWMESLDNKELHIKKERANKNIVSPRLEN